MTIGLSMNIINRTWNLRDYWIYVHRYIIAYVIKYRSLNNQSIQAKVSNRVKSVGLKSTTVCPFECIATQRWKNGISDSVVNCNCFLRICLSLIIISYFARGVVGLGENQNLPNFEFGALFILRDFALRAIRNDVKACHWFNFARRIYGFYGSA